MAQGQPVGGPRSKFQYVKDCCRDDPCCPTKDECTGDNKPDGLCSLPCRKTRLNKPLLDTETCFGVCELCGEEKFHNNYCACCGEHCKRKSKLTCKQQWCTFCFVVVLPCYLVLGGILQFTSFHFGTVRCGSGSPSDGYGFPGGGNNTLGGPEFNLVPKTSVIVETEPRWYGMQFDAYEANDQTYQAQKQIGTWFRTWGPFFSTYTYQDIQHSQPTVYMRPSWQSMIFQYYDDYIMRCDGKGEVIRISEGGSWAQNRVKTFFGSNTGFKLKVTRGGKEVAEAEETFHGGKSITFRNTSKANAENLDTEFASANVMAAKYEGRDQWSIRNEAGDKRGSLAFYQVQGMSVLYAFRIYNDKVKKKAISARKNQGNQEMASLTDETFQIKPENFEKFHTIGLNASHLEQEELHA